MAPFVTENVQNTQTIGEVPLSLQVVMRKWGKMNHSRVARHLQPHAIPGSWIEIWRLIYEQTHQSNSVFPLAQIVLPLSQRLRFTDRDIDPLCRVADQCPHSDREAWATSGGAVDNFVRNTSVWSELIWDLDHNNHSSATLIVGSQACFPAG